MKRPPDWLDVRSTGEIFEIALSRLDSGERSAIILAEELAADQLIIDDSFARRIAEERGLAVIGTVGVLREAAELGLLDLVAAFRMLQQTSFHISPALLAKLLDRSG